jgi:hypothetical protein
MSYQVSGSGQIGLWARVSGTWTKVGTAYVSGYDNSFSSAGVKTVPYYLLQNVTVTGPIDAFRVTVDSLDYGLSINLTSFDYVRWQSMSSTGTRSATPNGEQITATVRPQ